MTPSAALCHVVCLAAILTASTAKAGTTSPDRPADYAYTIPIYLNDPQAVVPLLLPRDAYLYSRSAGLDDLRVFDRDGAPMPFAMIPQPRVDRETTELQNVAVFPVRAPAADKARLAERLEVRASENGTVIAVAARRDGEPGQEEVLAALVLDLQAGEGAKFDPASAPVAGLKLALPDGMTNYHARIAVDTSTDLQHWSSTGETSLEWIVNPAGLSVRQDHVDMPADGARYVRIRWLEGTPVQFGAVKAERAKRTTSNLRWDTLTVAAQPGRVAGDLVYPTPPGIPVERIGPALLGVNAVVPAVLGQYVEAPPRKHHHARSYDFAAVVNTTFYHITQGERQRTALEVSVPPTHATHWVLRPTATLSERPALRIGWTPATLVFLATGHAPYTLAVGRFGAAPARQPLDRVAPSFAEADLAAMEHALTGTAVRQGPAAPAGAGAGTPRRTLRAAVLWAALVGAVAILAVMAVRLRRQMKKDADSGMEDSGGTPAE